MPRTSSRGKTDVWPLAVTYLSLNVNLNEFCELTFQVLHGFGKLCQIFDLPGDKIQLPLKVLQHHGKKKKYELNKPKEFTKKVCSVDVRGLKIKQLRQ